MGVKTVPSDPLWSAFYNISQHDMQICLSLKTWFLDFKRIEDKTKTWLQSLFSSYQTNRDFFPIFSLLQISSQFNVYYYEYISQCSKIFYKRKKKERMKIRFKTSAKNIIKFSKLSLLFSGIKNSFLFF